MPKKHYKKFHPPLTKSRRIQDYRSGLQERGVSDTKEEEDQFLLEDTGTGPAPDKETQTKKPKGAISTFNWQKSLYYIKPIGGIIAIITFIGLIVYHYSSTNSNIEHLWKQVSEIKDRMSKMDEEIRKDMRQINDRIDRVFSFKDEKKTELKK